MGRNGEKIIVAPSVTAAECKYEFAQIGDETAEEREAAGKLGDER